MHDTADSHPNKLQWHLAFFQALQVELLEYGDVLEFIYEHQLTAEPLRIDVLVIKKKKDAVIDKNIARIFKGTNILEYKSPEDFLSVGDFLKVSAYANQYASLSPHADAEYAEITLTFVTNRHPYKLMRYLTEVRKYTVKESSPGIYTVAGEYLPIQIIESKKLPESENLWLKALTIELRASSMDGILELVHRQGLKKYLDAYLNVLIRANGRAFEEVRTMAKSYPTMEEILIRTGLAQKVEELCIERGIEQAKETFVRNLLKEGLSIEKIAAIAELPAEKVRAFAEKQTP